MVVSSPGVLAVDVWQTHVVPLTSNLARAGLAGNAELAAGATGLPRAAVAVPLGLELIDRAWLLDRSGRLPPPLMVLIDAGVRTVLDL